MSQVLIVDDSAPLRAIEWRVLRESGLPFASALEAEGSRSALERLSAHPDVALVLVDLDLPGAIPLIRAVRRDTARGQLPIVVVSSGRARSNAASSAGADACLMRPFTADAVRDVMEPLLSVRSRAG